MAVPVPFAKTASNEPVRAIGYGATFATALALVGAWAQAKGWINTDDMRLILGFAALFGGAGITEGIRARTNSPATVAAQDATKAREVADLTAAFQAQAQATEAFANRPPLKIDLPEPIPTVDLPAATPETPTPFTSPLPMTNIDPASFVTVQPVDIPLPEPTPKPLHTTESFAAALKGTDPNQAGALAADLDHGLRPGA